MKTIQQYIKTGRQFFAQSGLLPILFSTGLAMILMTARIVYSRNITFVFLVWNLFLAWIPYLAALWAASLHQRFPHRWWAIIAPGVLWLAFFPNAPYIVTDFLHLTARPPVPMWFDIGLLATFAWAGLFLAVFSLWMMQRLVKAYLGMAVSWLFVLVVVGISGLGYMWGVFCAGTVGICWYSRMPCSPILPSGWYIRSAIRVPLA